MSVKATDSQNSNATLADYADVCRNGVKGCYGPYGDDLPCFRCYCYKNSHTS
jgi:hypothetical protein